MAKAFKRKTVRKMRNVFDDIDQAGEGTSLQAGAVLPAWLLRLLL